MRVRERVRMGVVIAIVGVRLDIPVCVCVQFLLVGVRVREHVRMGVVIVIVGRLWCGFG